MQKSIFVVMPYGMKEVRAFVPAKKGIPAIPALELNFDEVYEQLIAPAILQANCKPFRADKEKGAGDIRTDMFYELVTADIVLADISILNPNVFYELGIRHGVAPAGVFSMSGGWTRYPFDVAPDRVIRYNGSLFETGRRGKPWEIRLKNEIKRLAQELKEAIAADAGRIGSPLYKELPGLIAVDWSQIKNAKSEYFGQIFVDWKSKIKIARQNGFPGDILTLAHDAPTRFHRIKFLWEAANALIEITRFQPALHVLNELLALKPDSLDALAKKGLVLGRLGRTREAEVHLASVADKYSRDPKYSGDPELQGSLGRIYKDLWRMEWDDPKSSLIERQKRAIFASPVVVSAIRSYNVAFRKNLDSYYTGINIVALVHLIEWLKQETGEAAEDYDVNDINDVSATVRIGAKQALVSAKAQRDDEARIWPTASLAELELIAGNAKECSLLYRNAITNPAVSFFHLDSMLSQIRLFQKLGYKQQLVADIEKIFDQRLSAISKPEFRFDKIVVCSGHMIDSPKRPKRRFPAGKEKTVRQKMEKQIADWNIGENDLAICGGARGADILFAEICLKRKAEVWLFIALPLNEFLEESVRLPTGDWENRFFKLQAGGAKLFDQQERLGKAPEGSSPFARNNLWIVNSGVVEARSPQQLFALLVWDEKSTGDGPGGTADFAQRIESFGGRKKIINPTKG